MVNNILIKYIYLELYKKNSIVEDLVYIFNKIIIIIIILSPLSRGLIRDSIYIYIGKPSREETYIPSNAAFYWLRFVPILCDYTFRVT